MVQLTLPGTEPRTTVRSHVRALVAEWRTRMGDGAHVDAAARATVARFGSWGSRALGPAERARVSAYFAAVLRRRILRMSDGAAVAARRRLVSASIEADLLEAGWSPQLAAAEARRITGAVEDGRGAA